MGFITKQFIVVICQSLCNASGDQGIERRGITHCRVDGYTNGYTITLVLAGCSWQHLAEYKQNTAEHGLLGRTIFSSKHLICQHIMCNRLGV